MAEQIGHRIPTPAPAPQGSILALRRTRARGVGGSLQKGLDLATPPHLQS